MYLVFELPVKFKWYNTLLRRESAMVGVLKTAEFSCVRMIMECTQDEHCDMLLSLDAFIEQARKYVLWST
jgi:hypothetical protein